MKRCGFVAVVGAPNSGKSTLVNALVGAKVSIVSPKVQTTRMRVRGIAVQGDVQVVFVDTPGIFAPRRELDRAMVQAAWSGVSEADAVLVMIDARELSSAPEGWAARDTRAIFSQLKSTPKCALVLNKVDAMKRADLLPLAQKLNAEMAFQETFMISATRNEGLGPVLDWCSAQLPEGPWLYAEDQIADLPLRLLASEITREQLFLRLHDELPYATAVQTQGFEERKDGSVKIDQTIFVQRPGQKAIVLGKGGSTLKEIGSASRSQLETSLDRRVHLFLFVKVKEDWAAAREHFLELGLEYPEK
ncbi:MAG: GTPase Era [Alphaproteobacteria bacterium]|nr:GTPase Era [Alphaproteobacteria bacterium]